MLTARPESVQIMACETPLAMVRASAEPRSAIESNTSSNPLTVPIRPSSGESGTSTRISGKFVVMPSLRREIIICRIWRALHETWSRRAFQASSMALASPGRTCLKYQTRSRSSVHITTPALKIQKTNGPPPTTRSVAAATGMSKKSTTDPMLPLDALGQQTRALLVENLHHRLRERNQPRVGEEQRNRDAEPEHRRDHGLTDTVRHQLRIARARL